MQDEAKGLYDRLHEIHIEYFHVWKSTIFLSWRWWVGVGLIVIPWVVWLIVRKRGSTSRLLFVGAFIGLLASFLDMVGVALHLWYYPVTVFPLMPSFIPFDLSALPVTAMLWVQCFPKVRPIIKAIAFAVTGGFVFEPVCVRLGLVAHVRWEYWLTALALFFIYLLANFLSERRSFQPISDHHESNGQEES